MSVLIENNLTPMNDHRVYDSVLRTPVDADAIVSNVSRGSNEYMDRVEKTVTLMGMAGVDIEFERTKGANGLAWYEYSGLPDNYAEIMRQSVEKRDRQAIEISDHANVRLEPLKRLVASGLAKYGERIGVDSPSLEELFTRRLNSIQHVEVNDWILDEHAVNFSLGASFQAKKGYLRVDAPSMIKAADIREYSVERVVDSSVAHELEHAASFHGKNGHGAIPRKGLSVMNTNEDGALMVGRHGSDLLDEGAQEHILFHEDMGIEKSPSYMSAIMFWDMVIALDPDIEKLRYEAKFLNTSGARGAMVGRIELLLGPHAVEIIEQEVLPQHRDLKDYPDLKNVFVSMLIDEHIKDEAKAVLDRSQIDIFAPMGYGFTDDQLKLIRGRGGNREGIEPEYK